MRKRPELVEAFVQVPMSDLKIVELNKLADIYMRLNPANVAMLDDMVSLTRYFAVEGLKTNRAAHYEIMKPKIIDCLCQVCVEIGAAVVSAAACLLAC